MCPTMCKAVRIHETGGAEVLKWEDVEVGDPSPGEALLRHTAVGLNYIDIYHRSGLYPNGRAISGSGLLAPWVAKPRQKRLRPMAATMPCFIRVVAMCRRSRRLPRGAVWMWSMMALAAKLLIPRWNVSLCWDIW